MVRKRYYIFKYTWNDDTSQWKTSVY